MILTTLNNKTKDGYDQILEIEFDENVTRYAIPITITVNDDIEEKDIKIFFKEEERIFTLENNKVIFYASENGSYEIGVVDEYVDINITNINKFAPQIIGIHNYIDYIELAINDIYKEMNYNQSYIIYNDIKYDIPKDNKIIGTFKGTILVVIYTNNNQYAKYQIDLK
ncbi:MAG: hypothetical protein ACK5LC_10885 [Coprobacillaceae bacterium]